MNISELRAAMARKNISVPQLACLIGISKKTLYSRLSGKTDFNLSEIRKIAIILELSEAEILNIFFALKVA